MMVTILKLAYSEQRLIDLFQEAIRSIVDIFGLIAWGILGHLFDVVIRWLGRDAALVLEMLIAGGLAIATYIYMKKFVAGS